MRAASRRQSAWIILSEWFRLGQYAVWCIRLRPLARLSLVSAPADGLETEFFFNWCGIGASQSLGDLQGLLVRKSESEREGERERERKKKNKGTHKHLFHPTSCVNCGLWQVSAQTPFSTDGFAIWELKIKLSPQLG